MELYLIYLIISCVLSLAKLDDIPDYRPKHLAKRQISENDPKPISSSKTWALTPECLDCICQAGTGCSANVPCRLDKKESKTTLCGPLFITYYYWSDAGKPGSNFSNDDYLNFENCALQRPCADKAVLGYMERYAKDCNADGDITCEDFALIHKAGPSGCVKGHLPNHSKYMQLFSQCIEAPIPAIDPRRRDPVIMPR